jgi:hypothetical protein
MEAPSGRRSRASIKLLPWLEIIHTWFPATIALEMTRDRVRVQRIDCALIDFTKSLPLQPPFREGPVWALFVCVLARALA